MKRKNDLDRPLAKTKAVYCLIFAIAGLTTSTIRADFRDDVDFTKLKAEYGNALPDGSGVRVLQAEYMRNGYWAPQPINELSTKTFTYLSNTFGGYSDHANQVATYLAGTASSMTPGLTAWS